MAKVIKFSDFVVEEVVTTNEPLNEGLFDTLKNLYAKVQTLYNDPAVLQKQMMQAEVKAGAADDNISPKAVGNGTTVLVRLVESPDKAGNGKASILALTKLGDLPDGTGLFQITGSDSAEFLQVLGFNNIAQLNASGVLVLIGPEGFKTDRPLTMRVYKNISKEGTPSVTKAVVRSTLNADVVSKEKII